MKAAALLCFGILLAPAVRAEDQPNPAYEVRTAKGLESFDSTYGSEIYSSMRWRIEMSFLAEGFAADGVTRLVIPVNAGTDERGGFTYDRAATEALARALASGEGDSSTTLQRAALSPLVWDFSYAGAAGTQKPDISPNLHEGDLLYFAVKSMNFKKAIQVKIRLIPFQIEGSSVTLGEPRWVLITKEEQGQVTRSFKLKSDPLSKPTYEPEFSPDASLIDGDKSDLMRLKIEEKTYRPGSQMKSTFAAKLSTNALDEAAYLSQSWTWGRNAGRNGDYRPQETSLWYNANQLFTNKSVGLSITQGWAIPVFTPGRSVDGRSGRPGLVKVGLEAAHMLSRDDRVKTPNQRQNGLWLFGELEVGPQFVFGGNGAWYAKVKGYWMPDNTRRFGTGARSFEYYLEAGLWIPLIMGSEEGAPPDLLFKVSYQDGVTFANGFDRSRSWGFSLVTKLP